MQPLIFIAILVFVLPNIPIHFLNKISKQFLSIIRTLKYLDRLEFRKLKRLFYLAQLYQEKNFILDKHKHTLVSGIRLYILIFPD